MRRGLLSAAPPGSLALQFASGRTSAYQLPTDGGTFFLYVPSSHPISRRSRQQPELVDKTFPLLVLVHGSRRDAQGVRDAWSEFAERHQIVLLCPLFPADLESLDGVHNYKVIQHGGFDYAKVLLHMIGFVAREWGHVKHRFHLSGFSGGAQFVHRFWYLHPDRVASLSVGAPGAITRLDSRIDWPRGVKDRGIDVDEMRRARVLLVVGDADHGEGYSRVDMLRLLRDDLEATSIDCTLELVAGAAHVESALQAAQMTFVACNL